MDILLERIIKLIGDKRGETKELAKFIGVSPNTISDWKSERVRSYPKYAPRIAEFYGVSLDWLAGKSDIKKQEPKLPFDTRPYSRGQRVPVVGSVRAGYNGVAFENYDGFDYADVSCPEEYIYLRVNGDSMEPHISSGDLALVHRQPDVESGDIAVVIINGDEGTIKKIIKQNGAIILQAFNPSCPPRVISGEALNDIIIVGRVVKTIRNW